MEKKITALKVQKKDSSRINVYLDGSFAFGLHRVVGAWLHVGKILDEDEIDKLLAEDTKEKAYQKALRLLQYRFRSEKEISDKLQAAGYLVEVVTGVVERLKDNRLIGDYSFARNWMENRSTFRPRSHRMLRMELKQKGVEEDIISRVLEEAPDEEMLAETLAKKYQTRLAECDWPNFQKRMGGYLLRKGFHYSVIKDVIRKCWVEMQEESDSGNI